MLLRRSVHVLLAHPARRGHGAGLAQQVRRAPDSKKKKEESKIPPALHAYSWLFRTKLELLKSLGRLVKMCAMLVPGLTDVLTTTIF